METRVLLPKQLEIRFGGAKDPPPPSEIKETSSLKQTTKRRKSSKEKPTSSSGCGESELSDSSSDGGDSDFELRLKKGKNSNNKTNRESCSSEEEWEGEEKISRVWNPSYNLRRKGVRGTCSLGSVKEENKDGGEEELDTEDDGGGVVVANADSNNVEGSGGDERGKVGLFSELRILARRVIQKGTVLSGNEGEVCVLFVKEAPAIRKDDIRFMFGCFDRLVKDEKRKNEEEEEEEDEEMSSSESSSNGREEEERSKQIHLCNWIRFIKQVPGHDPRVNVRGMFVDSQPVFRFLCTVLPGQEIWVHLDVGKEKEKVLGQRGTLQQAPLDLSKSLTPEPRESKSTPITIFPFSINNVLQPGKLFQPYNHSPPAPHPHRHSHQEIKDNKLSNTSSLLAAQQTTHHHHHHRSLLNLPRSSSSSLIASHHGNHGNAVPGIPGIPSGLRPILRTRGRERSLLPCEVCGKAFDRPSLLKRHMRTHTGEKPHICDVCSKGFSTSSSLNTHRRIHSGEKPHQCPICGKRFTASSNLYYHRMTHNKEKPHKCLLCGKSFPTPGDLKSHQYVHSGSWPYNCPVCHRGFSKQTNLRNHLLLHSGDKPHNCQICGKKFALACNLRAHLRTHEEEPVSTCLTCKRTFLTSLNMLENGQCRACILLHHSQQQPANNNSSTSGGNQPPKAPSHHLLFPSQLPPSSSSSSGMEALKADSLALSALSKFVVSSPGSSHPSFPVVEDGLISPFGSLGAAVSSGSSSTSSPGGGYLTAESLLRPNPFLEQFLQWNWRFAKETAGNLGLMQQKLFESQMLAAQLMSVSSNGSLGSTSDILKFRL